MFITFLLSGNEVNSLESRPLISCINIIDDELLLNFARNFSDNL